MNSDVLPVPAAAELVDGPHGLSLHEVEVLQLLAQGRTNT
jgi:hypothetical protein